MKEYFVQWQKNLALMPKRKVLPFSYLILLVIGFFLSFVNLFVPALTLCASPFGSDVCAPFGMYLVVGSSFPGYLIVGILGTAMGTAQIPEAISMVFVGIISLLIYYVLGLLFDRNTKKGAIFQNKVYTIAFVSFGILLLLFLYLLYLSSWKL